MDTGFYQTSIEFMWFSFLILFKWWIPFIDLGMLNQPCIHKMIFTRQYFISLMYFWRQFSNILIRIFASIFISYISLYFSLLDESLSLLWGSLWLHILYKGVFNPFEFYGIIWERLVLIILYISCRIWMRVHLVLGLSFLNTINFCFNFFIWYCSI